MGEELAGVYRSWGRDAQARVLSEFLAQHDAGETEIRLQTDRPKKKGCLGRFVLEVYELEEDE